MDKELFKELEANLIRALELVRSAQTRHEPGCSLCDDPLAWMDKWDGKCPRCNRVLPTADSNQNSPQEQVSDDKVLSRDAEYYLEQLDAIQKVLGWKRAKDFVEQGQKE